MLSGPASDAQTATRACAEKDLVAQTEHGVPSTKQRAPEYRAEHRVPYIELELLAEFGVHRMDRRRRTKSAKRDTRQGSGLHRVLPCTRLALHCGDGHRHTDEWGLARSAAAQPLSSSSPRLVPT